ncbi:MAG: hypothetical protein U5L09_10590 [Bacteroidales bacterium]|nr:hypothetical protein [Bacteroidales bacterium]
MFISAKRKENLKLVTDHLLKAADVKNISENTVVSNARHYHELEKVLEAINSVEQAFKTGYSFRSDSHRHPHSSPPYGRNHRRSWTHLTNCGREGFLGISVSESSFYYSRRNGNHSGYQEKEE